MARQTRQKDGTRRVPVTLPREETAPEGWLRNLRFSGFTLLMLALVILAVIVLAPNLRILLEQRAQIAQLEQTVAEAESSVGELTEEVDRWKDPAYIEAQARERLNYVLPGDISYLVVGDTGAQQGTENGLPISDQIQTTKTDWLATLLSSIYTAGLTTAPAQDLETVP
ncbi:FtsB family cell division protein [Salinibacterium soli]|uniref:Septum formation initiator family protein n=1 Tax=Antiquaquibacter soli TaxID=3064523 RepID=A0ABT9BU09_9MICO|nr:septum formation initiator family protein [Protaetiibacter sp. WY-16]MDO7883286.1 septum formation initiator family protein [Protaetiibacter sp. WY-16]